MNKLAILLIMLLTANQSFSIAQTPYHNEVVVRVGDSSKMTLSIHDRKDLETLKHYDFQTLMNDLITKLENTDTVTGNKPASSYLRKTAEEPAITAAEPSSDTTRDEWQNHKRRKHWNKRTYHSFNVDLGTNNYLNNGKFPDQSNAQYTVKPWGSWYVGLNSIQRTHIGGKLFLEWGMGVSWYNFKFQDASTVVTQSANTISFDPDSRGLDYIKSKLTATYLNASFVPVIDFGYGGRKTTIFDGSRVDFSSRGNHSSGFRLGVGPYAGYRIDSYTKQVYKDHGQQRNESHNNTYFINNIRYGVRVQVGFNDLDLFFNYDLNSLFVDSQSPKLNAFSFGVTF